MSGQRERVYSFERVHDLDQGCRDLTIAELSYVLARLPMDAYGIPRVNDVGNEQLRALFAEAIRATGGSA